MPTKPATDLALKKTIGKPAVTGAPITPRKQPGSATIDSSAPSANPVRQPVGAQTAVKKPATTSAKTVARPRQSADANSKPQIPAPNNEENAQPNGNDDAPEQDTENSITNTSQSVRESDSNKSRSSPRPAAAVKPTVKSSVSSRLAPSTNKTTAAKPTVDATARNASAVQPAGQSPQTRAVARRTGNPAREDSASTQKSARTPSLRGTSVSTPRRSSKSSGKADDDCPDGKVQEEDSEEATVASSSSPAHASAVDTRQQLEQALRENAELRSDRDEKQLLIEQVQREHAELKAEKDRVVEQLTERESDLRGAAQLGDELRDELARRDGVIDEQRREIDRLGATNSDLERCLRDLRDQMDRSSRFIASLQADRASILRKFDVLGLVISTLQREVDFLAEQLAASEDARRSIAEAAHLGEKKVEQLTQQLQEDALQHAAELETMRTQCKSDLEVLEDRLNKQREEQIELIHEQHSAEVRTLRAFSDKQVASVKAEQEKTLREIESSHNQQLDERNKRDEKHLRELEAEHRGRLQQLESNYESSKVSYEHRIEALQADCNDLRHRVQLYEQTLQKQANVRSQIESTTTTLHCGSTRRTSDSQAHSRSDSDSGSSSSSVSSSADSLTARCTSRGYRPLPASHVAQALERERERERDREHEQSVSRSLQDNTLVSYAHLEQEIASLNTVIELRNGEIRDLRKQQAEMLRVEAEFADARTKIRELQMQIENLEALLAIKTDCEKALTEKHNMLLRKYEKETRAAKRLSMDYEEARFKLEQLEDVAKMRAEEQLSPRVSTSLASSLPSQTAMTVSCPHPSAVFGPTKHRHGSSSSSTSIPSPSPQARAHSASRPSSAGGSSGGGGGGRPRSYHAGQSHIPAPSSGVTMRRSLRAGTAPPERSSDSSFGSLSLVGSPSQLSACGLLRASTPSGEAWMIPLKEKSEDTGSSSTNSNSTVNLSGPTVLKRHSRSLSPENLDLSTDNGDCDGHSMDDAADGYLYGNGGDKVEAEVEVEADREEGNEVAAGVDDTDLSVDSR